MKKVILLAIILLLLFSCTENVKKESVIHYPKSYVIQIKFTDNSYDTIYYSARDSSKVIFAIKTTEIGFFSDTPISPTLTACFCNGYMKESISTNVRKYKILKEVY